MKISDEIIDAGAKILRERMQGGKKLVEWRILPNSSKKKWREYSALVLNAVAGDLVAVETTALKAELSEQGRLNGMGTERKLALMVKLEGARHWRDHYQQDALQLEDRWKSLRAERDMLTASLKSALDALSEIRDADQIEMVLDPEWPSRIARAALTPSQVV